MLFMVIERFRDNDMLPVCERLRAAGRSLPDGLEYVDSWVEANFSRCFQRCAATTCGWSTMDPSVARLGRDFRNRAGRDGPETRAVVAPFLEATPRAEDDGVRQPPS